MYVVDTVVFSELYKRQRDPGVVEWISSKSEELFYLSAITLGEIERGIESQRQRNPIYAEALFSWLELSIATYAGRILPVTTEIARRWGQLSSRLGHSGADLLIAATALEHGFIV